MDLEIEGFTLTGLSEMNVLLGKNGCGKSHLLKAVDIGLQGRPFGRRRYITPQRGGLLRYEAGVDGNIASIPDWLSQSRRTNQLNQFREQSVTHYRLLELHTLREESKAARAGHPLPQTFEAYIEKLNGLLDRVRLEPADRDFVIINKVNGAVVTAESISSGEAELITLAIEFLAFVKECDPAQPNVLLVDEPDVHLHPDLQDRLARFMVDIFAQEASLTVLLATHSTALLAALSAHTQVNVSFMREGQRELRFRPVDDIDRQILPIFGAHPLSNVFNQAPILLIEGEDDERIWQQARRSAGQRIRLYPCVVDSVDRLHGYEVEVNRLIEAVYDDAKAFSLRDSDGVEEELDDVGYVKRMRLGCRAAENLMLSDDCLRKAGSDWEGLRAKIDDWLRGNATHPYHHAVRAFADAGYDRKGHDLKDIRNILISLISTKPWEVLVGQTIAKLVLEGGDLGDHSLRSYLEEKVCRELLQLPEVA